MSWNQPLDFFIEVKNEFVKVCGKDALWQYDRKDSSINCLSYWVWTLGSHNHPKYRHYAEMIEPLLLNESMGMLLIKYKDLGIDWNAYNCFYRECRSVVIDIFNDCLVLTPFRKFFNINELEETQIHVIQEKINNGACVEITDKIDGSMCGARWYHENLVISGSQALDVNKSYRLGNYYHWMYQHEKAIQMLRDYDNFTFIFEGVFPNDVHVVQYDEQMFGLHLLGMRRVADGFELPYKDVVAIANNYDVPHVKIFDMTFEEAYYDALHDGRKANEGEGYVIDVDGQKYKLKYDSYIQIHRAISKLISPNSIIKAIYDNCWDDFYSKIPLAYQPRAKEIADDVFEYLKRIKERTIDWYNIAFINSGNGQNRKEFMLAVNDLVPRRYQGNVRNIFLNKEINYLHNIKYKDIQDYLELLDALNNYDRF